MNGPKPLTVTTISHYGPIIEVILKKPGSEFAGLFAKGLIDTGATDILISPDIAEKLELKYVNDDTMDIVGGGTLHATMYSGWIEVPDLGFGKILPLHAVAWKQSSHTVLLGRRFLSNFIFNYDGPKGMFHFSTPIDGTHETLENFDG